ncbi:MAG: transglycosylase domain-containing protein [Actinomycetota bacterium]
MARGNGASPRAPRGPLTDRWSFKPVAVVLLVTVVVATAGLTAIVMAPPFIGAGMGVKELERRLNAVGADFTRIPQFPQRSTIYANDGTTILARIYLDNREIVRLEDVSGPARKAVLAIEDSAFYDHGALNLASIFRAMVENVKAGTVTQGGSTITQQLVKQTLGLDPNDLSFERKFQEAALAIQVERRYSKDRILEMYLNYVFYGNNVYGIGTAAEFYFHKPASELTLREGALLAGLIRAPAYYDPLERPRKAKLRRDDVLNRMMALGPSWLSEERGQRIKQLPLGLPENVGKSTLPTPPFLVNYVREQIVGDPNGWYTVLGETPKERRRSLSRGGLDIITTLDPALLDAAERAADLPWARTPLYPNHDPPADVGLVSLDVESGAILTMLSGKDYENDKVDTVTTAHQPGSSFKPYVLAAAFESGIAPSATYSGVQGVIDDERCETDGVPWTVINAEGSSRGNMNLYDATAASVNAVFARLILDAGLERTVDVAQRMGVKSPLVPVCSLATGSVGISPLDQASGYQTLANSGLHCEPYAVSEIYRGEQILFRQRPDCERAISSANADLITTMLEGVVDHGTAASVFSSGWGPWPIAGKTGTADANTNVWFVGYSRQVVTAVWVGSQGEPYPLSEFFGSDVFGSTVAAPIWKAFMLEVLEGASAVDFHEAELVSVPYLIGLTESEARAALRAVGLRARSGIVDSYRTAGTVAEQDPGAGAQTVTGATVTISISNGVASEVTVPVLEGLTVQEATARLGALHLFVAVTEKNVRDEALHGIVLSAEPAAGSVILEGSTVTLVVGTDPSPEDPNPTATPSPHD